MTGYRAALGTLQNPLASVSPRLGPFIDSRDGSAVRQHQDAVTTFESVGPANRGSVAASCAPRPASPIGRIGLAVAFGAAVKKTISASTSLIVSRAFCTEFSSDAAL